MKLEQRAWKFLGRDSDAEDFQITRTEGSYVVDARGKRYIDVAVAEIEVVTFP